MGTRERRFLPAFPVYIVLDEATGFAALDQGGNRLAVFTRQERAEEYVDFRQFARPVIEFLCSPMDLIGYLSSARGDGFENVVFDPNPDGSGGQPHTIALALTAFAEKAGSPHP